MGQRQQVLHPPAIVQRRDVVLQLTEDPPDCFVLRRVNLDYDHRVLRFQSLPHALKHPTLGSLDIDLHHRRWVQRE